MIKLLALLFLVMLPVCWYIHHYFLVRSNDLSIHKGNTTGERWASQKKPILGGVGFFLGFVICAACWIIWAHIVGVDYSGTKALSIVIAATIAFASGLIDDVFNTPPSFKFFMQFVVSVILIHAGICINIFENMILNYALTVFWVVGIMNSLNMLDNMDAITTSISTIIMLGMVAIMLLTGCGSSLLLFTVVGVLAATISFLAFNWHPSSMYMGDNGSQFIGAFVSILSIETLWNTPSVEQGNWLINFVLIFMAFIVPITDTTTVSINRTLRGQMPFVGGTDHTTHHLFYMHLNEHQVALVLGFINLISVAAVVMFIVFPSTQSLYLKIAAFAAIAISLTLYSITRITKRPTVTAK